MLKRQLLSLVVVLALSIAFACAEKRTRYSDKVMRVMIDPDSIDSANYVRLQQALIESGKWSVIDRYQAWKAIKKEQDRLHRNDPTRYEDKEKWTMWGKMYGVGGVIVANAQCQTNFTWYRHHEYELCLQSLSIVDSNTGEVITMISHEQEGEVSKTYIAPSWEDSVYALNKSYPDTFKSIEYTDRLKEYSKAAEANALEQKKIMQESNRAPASAPLYIEHTNPIIKAN